MGLGYVIRAHCLPLLLILALYSGTFSGWEERGVGVGMKAWPGVGWGKERLQKLRWGMTTLYHTGIVKNGVGSV